MSDQSMIPGDIAYIKFTGEAVGILSYRNGSNTYEVRRCMRGKHIGSQYVKETYEAFELEDETSHSARQREEYDAMAKALKSAGVAILDDRKTGPSFPPTGGFAV
jgi:hypothetical protein